MSASVSGASYSQSTQNVGGDMRDFLRGTLAAVLQFVLIGLGVVLLGASCVMSLGSGVLAIVSLVLGILCFCAAAGIRYWRGRIVRIRND